MSRATKKEREEFVARMTRELASENPEHVARWCGKIMRHAATYARLQEAQCNGDYPADGATYCNRCGAAWRANVIRNGICPDCRAEDAITALCAEFEGVTPIFSGDPRGATVKIKVPSGYSNSWGGEGICVPTS